jgi:hypothetical protein
MDAPSKVNLGHRTDPPRADVFPEEAPKTAEGVVGVSISGDLGNMIAKRTSLTGNVRITRLGKSLKEVRGCILSAWTIINKCL